MTPIDLLHAAIVVILIATIILWRLPSPCTCDRCAFHVRERQDAASTKRAREKAAVHEIQHKGWSSRPEDPDRWDCPDQACRRNKSRE